jgi:negative regulator of replication initiation
MNLIGIMAGTTISVSEKFHDWLKSHGKKGESYEKILRRMLKQEFLKELEALNVKSK